MKTTIIAMLVASVAVSARGASLGDILTMSIPKIEVQAEQPVSISTHCVVVSEIKQVLEGKYDIPTYAVGRYKEDGKLVSETYNYTVSKSAHVWCIVPVGYDMSKEFKQ